MTYLQAKKCFSENCDLVDPAAKPLEWNLNAGLLALTKATERDAEETHRLLKQILDELQRRR